MVSWIAEAFNVQESCTSPMQQCTKSCCYPLGDFGSFKKHSMGKVSADEMKGISDLLAIWFNPDFHEQESLLQEALCAGDLASRAKELSNMTAERNKYRSKAAHAERQADRLTQRLASVPKVLSCLYSWR